MLTAIAARSGDSRISAAELTATSRVRLAPLRTKPSSAGGTSMIVSPSRSSTWVCQVSRSAKVGTIKTWTSGGRPRMITSSWDASRPFELTKMRSTAL